MTAIESVLKDLKQLRMEALNGDQQALARFANMTLAAWPTIQHALEELDRRRIV